ncbi:hypothetical protein EWM64_g970 [Hericium alpestre]|uniref:Spc7 kinetochore protein domain-containing protein n=1 Tax=Hericium alpestre TaxID=135208 RepID=A0A4Z0A925_9AGAM|nr:hypothetical protein EWM64_g970 [Hericium alpestre]
MELTRDLRAESRKSLGRRVSFAPNASVRLFQVAEQNTNSTQSPDSSPVSEASPHVPPQADENAYPGAGPSRRRSSVRRSVAFSENGEASMEIDSDFDDTGVLPPGFLLDGSDLQDEEFDEGAGEFDDEDDMDMTEAMSSNPQRRKSRASLGLGAKRRSSVIPRSVLAEMHNVHVPEEEPEPVDGDVSIDEHTQTTDMTQSSTGETSGEHTQPMEFTVPLNKSLRKPEPPSKEWLALRAMTHSGDTPYDPPPSDQDEEDYHDLGLYPPDAGSVSMATSEDMDLTTAQTRLLAMRQSMGGEPGQHDDSFTSSEGGSMDMSDPGLGNQTLNLTNVWRQSMGGTDFTSSSMDLTSIRRDPGGDEDSMEQDGHHSLLPTPESNEEFLELSIPPSQSPETGDPSGHRTAEPLAPSSVFQPPPTVFSAPPPKSVSDATQGTSPPAPGPVFAKPGSVFSAQTGSVPAKPPSSPRKGGTAAFAPPVARPQPAKRPVLSEVAGEDLGSPTKRQSVAARASMAAAGRLSPRKNTAPAVTSNVPTGRRPSVSGTLRRPSAYFTQRKSLGPSVLPDTTLAQPGSPRNNVPGAAGRASVGSMAELSGILERPFSTIYAHQQEQKDSREREDIGDVEPRLPSSPRAQSPARRVIKVPSSPAPAVAQDDDQEQAMDEDVPDDPMGAAGPTEQWRAGLQQQESFSEDGPPISIEQFFAMTGVRFMDELTAPRRSTIHPSQLQPLRRRSSLSQEDIPLADYIVAMTVDAPQLEQYSRVAKDLQSWIENSKKIYRQAEEEAAIATPTLFREYSAADEDVKEELLHQLKLIKANNHGNARSQWYDWRLQWVQGLHGIAEKGFSDLEKDARTLEATIDQAQAILPSLREEHARVMAELEQEQAIATEIENCDQDYLAELKATLAEQEATLEAYRADVSETNAKLERLQEKLDEIDTQKKEANSVIQESQRHIHIQKSSTRAEVFRLRDDLDALEELHLWRPTKIQPDLFELVYASRYCVTVPCIKFRPIVQEISIARTKEMPLKFKDQFPRFSDISIKVAEQQLAAATSELSTTEIVERLGDIWSACAQLRTQFTLLVIRYPLAIDPMPAAKNGTVPGFKATATVLLPSIKSKIYISFIFTTDTLIGWPMSIPSMTHQVKVAYGPADVESIRTALSKRLAQATPDDNHECLLDACAEATCDYES